jgi:hypothetical protein
MKEDRCTGSTQSSTQARRKKKEGIRSAINSVVDDMERKE